MNSVFATYFAAHFPSWVLTAAAVGVLHHWTMVPGWLAMASIVILVGKDLLLFPRRRWLYCSDPAERRIVGQRGMTVTALAPDGYVRVQGELWQAQAGQPLTPGTRVRVHDVTGLRLHVTPDH